MQFYNIEYSKNPFDQWNKLKTNPPVDKQGYDSLYEFCKATSRYHFDETINDLESFDSDCPVVIPIKNFTGNWKEQVNNLTQETKPELFAKRAGRRMPTNNDLEANDFKKWGYDIDTYAIANRVLKPELTDELKSIVESFCFVEPCVVKFDVQMPGQCFYWHLDNFGGVLKKFRGDYEKAGTGDIDQRDVMRLIIFLEDQKQGQVWQQGNLLLNWKKGDCITWPWKDIPHGTCNYGHSPRPVLNVTGIVTDKTREFLTNV